MVSFKFLVDYSPSQMWKQTIKALFGAVKTGMNLKVQRIASSLAYITVLSIIPMLALSLSVSKAFGILPKFIEKLEPIVLNFLAVGSDDQFVTEMQLAIERINEGAMGSLGVVTLLVTSTILIHEINNAIQISWGIKERRPLVRRILSYWLIIALGPILIAILLGLMSPQVIGSLGTIPSPWIAFTLIFIFIFLTFKTVPNTRVKVLPALSSALATSIFLFSGQYVYAWATSSVLYHNKIYGSLAAIPLFLLWVWTIWLIFLFGNVLCFKLQAAYFLRGKKDQ